MSSCAPTISQCNEAILLALAKEDEEVATEEYYARCDEAGSELQSRLGDVHRAAFHVFRAYWPDATNEALDAMANAFVSRYGVGTCLLRDLAEFTGKTGEA